MVKYFLAASFLLCTCYNAVCQCMVFGKFIDNHSKGIARVQINIRTTAQSIQRYSGSNGEFSISLDKLKYDDLITLYISSTNFEPIEKADLTFQIRRNKPVEIRMAPIGLKGRLENDYLRTALASNAKQMKVLTKKLNQLLQQPNFTTKERNSLEDSIKANKVNDSVIMRTGHLYAKTKLGKPSPEADRAFALIKNGQTAEARNTLFDNSNDTTEEKMMHTKIEQWYEKAELAKSLLEYDKADTYYKRVLNFDQDEIKYRLGYVRFLSDNERQSNYALSLLTKVELNQITVDSIKADILNYYGILYSNLSKNDLAFSYYMKQVELASHSNFINRTIKSSILARAYNNIGNIYFNQNDSLAVFYYKKGIQCLYKVKDLKKNTIDTFSVFVTLNWNLGIEYQSRGNLQIAKSYFEVAMTSLKARKRKGSFERLYFFDVNKNLCEIRFSLEKNRKSIDSNNVILDSLLVLNSELNNNFAERISRFYSQQASNYASIGDFTNSYIYYGKSLDFLRTYFFDTSIEHTTAMGDVFLDLAIQAGRSDMKNQSKIYYDSARLYYLKSTTIIDFQLDNLGEKYSNFKFYNQLKIANWYALQNAQSKRLQYINNASKILSNSTEPDSLKYTHTIALNDALADYFKDNKQYSNAFDRRMESINIYKNKVQNNFLNELKLAALFQNAADDMYLVAESSDSVIFYQKTVSLFLEALSIYKGFYQLDSVYLSNVAYLKYSLGMAYRVSKSDSLAKDMYVSAIDDYLLMNRDNPKIDIINTLSEIYFYTAKLSEDTNEKIKYFKRALQYADILRRNNPTNEQYKFSTASTLNNIGVNFAALHLIDSSIRYFNLALLELGDIHDKDKQCLACWVATRENLADYFKDLQEKDKELQIRLEDIKFIENDIKIDSLHKYFDSSNAQSLYGVYSGIASIYQLKIQYDSAVAFMEKAINVIKRFYFKDYQTSVRLNSCYNNLGYYQILAKQPSQAIKSIKIAISYPADTSYLEGNYINLVFAYIFNNNFSKAIKSYHKIIDKIPSRKESFEHLIFEEMADYEKKLMTHNDFTKLKEHISKKNE